MLQDLLLNKVLDNTMLGQKIQNGDDVSVKKKYALDATEKNPNIEGTLAEQIDKNTDTINQVKSTVENLVALPSGASTAADAEIAAAKIGIKGETYSTLQNSITGQIQKYRDVKVSNEKPAVDDYANTWINTAVNEDTSANYEIPQINDIDILKHDTWSSRKINNELDTLNDEMIVVNDKDTTNNVTDKTKLVIGLNNEEVELVTMEEFEEEINEVKEDVNRTIFNLENDIYGETNSIISLSEIAQGSYGIPDSRIPELNDAYNRIRLRCYVLLKQYERLIIEVPDGLLGCFGLFEINNKSFIKETDYTSNTINYYNDEKDIYVMPVFKNKSDGFIYPKDYNGLIMVQRHNGISDVLPKNNENILKINDLLITDSTGWGLNFQATHSRECSNRKLRKYYVYQNTRVYVNTTNRLMMQTSAGVPSGSDTNPYLINAYPNGYTGFINIPDNAGYLIEELKLDDDSINIFDGCTVEEYNSANDYFISREGWFRRTASNTLSAIKYARTHGYKNARITIDFTSDNVPVLCHDNKIYVNARNKDGSEITDETLDIRDITLVQANEYDWGIKYGRVTSGIGISTLDEVLQYAKCNDMKLKIELRYTDENKINNLISTIIKHGMVDKLIISGETYQVSALSLIANELDTIGIAVYGNSETDQDVIDTALQFVNNKREVWIDTFTNDKNRLTDDMLKTIFNNKIHLMSGSVYNFNDMVDMTSGPFNWIQIANVEFPNIKYNETK